MPKKDIRWVAGDNGLFTRNVISEDSEPFALGIENGMGTLRAQSGVGVNQSNQREFYTLPGTESLTEHARTSFYSGQAFGDPGVGSINPQHGIGFRMGNDGSRKSIITVDNNVFFGVQWSLNASVWSSDMAGGNFRNRQSGVQFSSLFQSDTVLSIVRAGNVVTAVVAGTKKWYPGDRVNPNVATTSFNVPVVVQSVSIDGLTLTWNQTGVNESGGTGSINKVFPYDVEIRINPPGSTKIEVRAKKYDQPDMPPWLSWDNTAGVYTPSVPSGTILSTPTNAVFNISAICMMAELTCPDWFSTALNDPLICKRSSTAGQWSWIWSRLGTSAPAGRLEFFWTEDGSTSKSAVSTVAVPFGTGPQRGAVAVILIPNNGSGGWTVRFYTAPKYNGPWTQLGADVTGTPTTSIFQGNSPVEVGSQQGGSNAFRRLQAGTILHAALVRNGSSLTATPVMDLFLPNYENTLTSFDCRAGRTFTVASPGVMQNAAVPYRDVAMAYCVDLNESGTEADRLTLNPCPTDTTRPMGITASHLGTDSRSAAVFGRTVFGDFTDEDFGHASPGVRVGPAPGAWRMVTNKKARVI